MVKNSKSTIIMVTTIALIAIFPTAFVQFESCQPIRDLGVEFDSDCSHLSIIPHLFSCEATCLMSNEKFILECLDGIYFSNELPVFINSLCDENRCKVPNITGIGNVYYSSDCYKMDFFQPNMCTVFCEQKPVAKLICFGNQTIVATSNSTIKTINQLQNFVCEPPLTCENSVPSYTSAEIVCETVNRIRSCFSICLLSYVVAVPSRTELFRNVMATRLFCSNGFWGDSNCIKGCPSLEYIENGFYVNKHCIEGSTTDQKICEYGCFDDFEPIGAKRVLINSKEFSYIECINGQWDSIPACNYTRVYTSKCENVLVPNGNQYNMNITECSLDENRALCHFVCTDNHLVSNAARQIFYHKDYPFSGVFHCENEAWQVHACVKKCDSLLTPLQSIFYENDECFNGSEESVCYYMCSNGYRFSRSAYVVTKNGREYGVLNCRSGVWQNPECEMIPPVIVVPPPRMKCRLPRMDFSQIQTSDECKMSFVDKGTTCSFICRSGTFEDTKIRSFMSDCISPEWTNEPRKLLQNTGILSSDTLKCNAKCSALNVSGYFNLLEDCENTVEYNHGKACLVNCIFGNLKHTELFSVLLYCNDGSWEYDRRRINFNLVCNDHSPELVRETSLCDKFESDDLLKKRCYFESKKLHCYVWCPTGLIKHFNEFRLKLICGFQRHWKIQTTESEKSVIETLLGDQKLECPKFCEKVEKKENFQYSSNCDETSPAFTEQRCQITCPHSPFEGMSTNTVELICNDGVWIKEREQGVGFEEFEVESLVCPEIVLQKVCEVLPILMNGAFTGRSCVENVVPDTLCTFRCSERFTAEPPKSDECNPAIGVIRCSEGVWDVPICKPPYEINDRITPVPQPDPSPCERPLRRPCEEVPQIRNGHYVSVDQDISQYQCDQDYYCPLNRTYATRRSNIRCDDGKWQFPTCFGKKSLLQSLGLQINIQININSEDGLISFDFIHDDPSPNVNFETRKPQNFSIARKPTPQPTVPAPDSEKPPKTQDPFTEKPKPKPHDMKPVNTSGEYQIGSTATGIIDQETLNRQFGENQTSNAVAVVQSLAVILTLLLY